MRVQCLSTLAAQFEAANRDLATASQSGIPIRIIEWDNRLHLLLEIREESTHQDLRDALWLAIAWKERLLAWQGPWMGGGRVAFMEELHRRHRPPRRSYAVVAEEINQMLASSLQAYYRFFQAFLDARDTFQTMGDYLDWVDRTPGKFGLEHARDVLEDLGYNSSQIDEVITPALRRIEAGSTPFQPGEPIARDKVRELLRSWRQGATHRWLIDHGYYGVDKPSG